MADDTIVIFTADHGNMLGDHGRWFKGVMYEGSSHVPMIWRGVKGAKENGGKIAEQPIENLGVMPALLEAAGLPVPEGVQGKSFLKLARGGDPKWKSTVFSQLRDRMWIEGGFKYIESGKSGDGQRELFDMRNDPKEERNLAAEPAHRERVERSRERIKRVQEEKPVPVRIAGMSTPAYAQLDDATRKAAIARAPDNINP